MNTAASKLSTLNNLDEILSQLGFSPKDPDYNSVCKSFSSGIREYAENYKAAHQYVIRINYQELSKALDNKKNFFSISNIWPGYTPLHSKGEYEYILRREFHTSLRPGELFNMIEVDKLRAASFEHLILSQTKLNATPKRTFAFGSFQKNNGQIIVPFIHKDENSLILDEDDIYGRSLDLSGFYALYIINEEKID